MAKAEIVTIGTELLLGEIIDTNSRYIARTLRDEGVDLYWTSSVGDNPERIAEAIKQGLTRSEIIITTGGLGPTIDDPTRDAVALAFGVPSEYRPELWEQIKERFARFGRIPTENNKRQAYTPQGAIAIENLVGTAPAFIMATECNAVIALPGVPREMEHLMQHDVIPYLRKHFDLSGIIKGRIIRTAGVGESQIDEIISDLEEGHNPTVGLSAHAGSVDVRITAKADSETAADELIAPVEAEIRRRLGEWIYGADKDTLESAALDSLKEKGWRLAVVEAGLSGQLAPRLAAVDHPLFTGGEILPTHPDADELRAICQGYRAGREADVCVGVALQRGESKQTLHMVVLSPVKERSFSRTYGGPPLMAANWAVNLCLDFIRRLQEEA